MSDLDRYRGCLLGLAIGDAIGTTVEFKPRGSFSPVTDMLGGGPFHLLPGQWTDDTSMALCLAASLIETSGFDAEDQLRRYLRWYDDGYMSSTGRCFDIGTTILAALEKFRASGKPFAGSSHPSTAGNGSLMRLAPVALAYAPDRKTAVTYAARSSRTTHAEIRCVEACMLFADMLVLALMGNEKERILFANHKLKLKSREILSIATGTYRGKPETQIRGNGFVVDSLEAALWSFWTTDSFEQAILRAVNLGEDADTTAAICGQIAGAFYGMRAIPDGWLEKVFMREEITTMADSLAQLKR